MRVVSFFRQENLKRLLTFMTMHHKTKVEMAWISCGKLLVNVREGGFIRLNSKIILPTTTLF